MNRKSKFELLRIVLILMVITVHYFGTGKALTEISNNNFNYYITHFIESFCIIAVNTFIVMTGYFMTDKKRININKTIKLLADMIVYGILIYLFLVLIGKVCICKESIVKLLNSFVGGTNWFIIIYCILYLLIPYINKLLMNISEKEYKILLCISIIFFCLWPTIIPNKTTVADSGLGIINFIILYMLGVYIKKYFKIEKYSLKKYILFYISISIVTFIYSLIPSRAFCYNSIFNIIGAIALFLTFCKMKEFNNERVNQIAQNTFGIYIIHANVFISDFLWNDILKCREYYYKEIYILHTVCSIILVYLFSMFINIIIQKVCMKYIYKIIDKKVKVIEIK